MFRELEYVQAIALEKSITKAARRLGVSQPAVSRGLANIEKELGIKLFEKNAGEYLPTPAGQLYINYAKDMISRKAQFEIELGELLSYRQGRLVYGITPGRSKSLTPDVLPKVRREFPNIKIDLIEDNVGNLEELLRKATVDAAYFTLGNEKEDTSLYSRGIFDFETLGEEEIVLTVKKGTPLKSNPMLKFGFLYPWIDISELQDQVFISLKKNMRLGQITKQILSENNITPEVLELASIDTAQELAKRGYGVCLCSSLGVREYRDVLDIYSFGKVPIKWKFVAAYRVGSYMTEPLRYLTACYKKAADNMRQY